MRRQDKRLRPDRPPTQHGRHHKAPPVDPKSIPDPLDSIRIQISTEIIAPRRKAG